MLEMIHHDRRPGAGPTVLFVPGLGMTARCFAPVVAALGTEYDVVTVDLRGHGASPEPPLGWTIEDAADDLAQLVERLDLRDVTLVGWSLGATVTYNYLERHGTERVSRLVSVEMSPSLLREEGWEHAAFGGLDAVGALQATRQQWTDPDAYLTALMENCFASGSEPDPAVLQPLLAESLRTSRLALLALWSGVLGQDWRERIGGLALPTLLVHGAKSRIFPTEVGKWLLTALPDARLEMFPHSGHAPFLEEPDRFVQTLRDFVDRTAGA
ncbi:alpha/beta fold hydrolase [Streptacidiphilus anmyonensis]|uniref:alpha/beta fold hydrolase n=1 Tax=Streptacidiphilus anmyonensis TaxID=405782 RepID=UPI000A01B8BC|nr:alpha/beta hydrolase [Streptacidiphilus anmyonensis]